MSDPSFEPPVNKLPQVVVLLFLAIAGVEGGLALGEAGLIGGPSAIGWRLELIRDWGFSGDIFNQMLASGQWPLRHVARFVTYPFIYFSFSQSIFAMVLLLALGKLVGEAMGQVAVFLIFFLSGIGGALIYALLLNDPAWLVGAYPSVYGLIGGYSFVTWHRLGAGGGQQMRAFTLIAMLMGLQLVFSMFASVGMGWVAELAGFVCGFGLSFLVVPGGFSSVLRRFRHRS
ncbi:rhomboid family intramembrane serine protease [Sulfitobacter sp. SK012]|uniref:rhomboid family intramembrane serine protease n=1 Tax=Sulfitobacter sp. SK012 TaxID=1389005 RepID=UPI000E0A2CA3|nr:rhomboid family intramembrane serine protease [Sulfitobacter sp. SK012]AXI48156.1 rhomboid family intramembrane serine protease [Sulfitobacter sp. SK012]